MRGLLKGVMILGSVMLLAGCARGPMGPEGPAGAPGATGAPGVSLIKQYTGTISSTGSFEVLVPEISGRNSTTYVDVYFTTTASPDIWTPMTDGYSTTSRYCQVSWSLGKVYLNNMTASDLYMIKVYQNQ